MNPDIIYLADKTKIDVDRLRFDSSQNSNQINLQNKHLQFLLFYFSIIAMYEFNPFNFHLYWNILFIFYWFCWCNTELKVEKNEIILG